MEKIPQQLTSLNQWVLWKVVARGSAPTKVPYQTSGTEASSTDPATWTTFEAARRRFACGGYDGLGFVFANGGGLVGIDLDGCRDPISGQVAEWAREIIIAFNTYTEVSPSLTGVKLFCRGEWSGSGKKLKLADEARVSQKEPGIEIYGHGRYFAVTGKKLAGVSGDVEERQKQIDSLVVQFWPAAAAQPTGAEWRAEPSVIERARSYLAKLPPAISGQGGHNAAFHAACVLVLGFGLHKDAAMHLLREWNQLCQPPWTERELEHKVNDATKQPGERNYLRNAKPDNWDKIKVPSYTSAKSHPPGQLPKREIKIVTLADAAKSYIAQLETGKEMLVDTGLPDVDHAIGGGVAPGEMVLMCARPSHGKSAVALQCAHAWTGQGRPVLMISEEMSSLALGRRTLQFITDEPEEHWRHRAEILKRNVLDYEERRAPGLIAESCGSLDAAVEQIEKHVESHKIQAAIVDYAQILRGAGKNSYEQISRTSITLKQACAKHNLILVLLCQLSREIEKRTKFVPVMSDIKETGQLEQDADVILFLVWPHKINSTQPAEEFKVFVAKNRNRPINKPAVTLRFMPSRQMLLPEKPKYEPKREARRYAEFDEFNERDETVEF